MDSNNVTIQNCKGKVVRLPLNKFNLHSIENAFPGMQEIYYMDNKDKIPIMLNRKNNSVVMPPSTSLDPSSGLFVVTDQDGLNEGFHPLTGFCDWTEWSQVIESKVISGASLLRSTLTHLMDIGFMIVCGIQVENWTKFTLTNPNTTLEWGYLSSPATNIQPATREAMVSHKCGFTATGTSGTVSWLINGTDRRLVIAWSAPFNFDFYSNYLILGLTNKGYKKHNKTWFQTMYYEKEDEAMVFKRVKCRFTSNEVMIDDDLFEVTGTMDTSHKPEIKVIIKPKRWENLASKLKN
ncbi:tereporin-Ca1-like [Mytilus californianus]|uniref:tereporin-Ca1-like n=1 Tax=Mytilus californianus TaxID=6549 RepID=UPI002247669C|nr:tereporin-Ca1-like [Mytilus californianus]XP_052067711.1 tereporin-Ca1-like [Mytilus californianus]